MARQVSEFYLPTELYGPVEARVLAHAPNLAGEFVPASEVQEKIYYRLSGAPITNCIENLTARFKDGPTYFVLVRTNTPTALIATFGDFQCIVISESVHMAFSILMGGLFGWTPLLAFVRDGGEPEDDGAPPTRTRREAIEYILYGEILPTAESRSWTATLGYFLMYFLAAHEIGHLALGHLGSEDLTQGHISESEPDGPEGRLLERRAMEWEADGFAALAAVWQAASLSERGDKPWADLIKDRMAAIRVFMVGAYVLFSIMDLASPRETPSESRTHPAPMVRVSLTALFLTALADLLGLAKGDLVLDECRRAIKAVEIALNKVGGGMMDQAEADVLGGEAEASVESLESARQLVKGRLDRCRLAGYAWGGPFG